MRKLVAPALILLTGLTGCSAASSSSAAPGATASAAAPATTAGAESASAPAAAATKTTKATAATKAGACRSEGVKTSVELQEAEGTTQRAMVIVTNSGKSNCTLDGWVAISLVNAADEVVDVPTSRVKEPGPAEPITLKPGTSAFAGIKWTSCDKGDDTCGVGNTLRYNLEASTDGPVAELSGFPNPESSAITMTSLKIGTLQPSNQGVVAW
ncbi:DUF4232 domain-containing protein [Actinoplanes sp. NPDC051851]|uniref:DUF4232 domain-containing protein n=1 Tax=Actinoplanes sp. NPDC051851 TaxID=3154753 RepID=UPI0034152DCA